MSDTNSENGSAGEADTRGGERRGGRRLDRRAVLAGAAGTLAVAGLAPLRARAQAAAPAVTALGGRISLVTGVGGNVLIYVGAGDAVVVDSGAPGRADDLLAVYAELAGDALPRALFNTHWHLDQVGGNAALGARGAPIIAHAKTHAHLTVPYYLPAEDRYQPPLPEAAQPTETFHIDGSLELADERIGYGYLLEAHTDGDIFIRFENENLIAAGDAISPERDPAIDWYGGGWLGGRIDSLELLLGVGDARTRYVPSYGPVVDRSYVEAEHALMLGLYEILWERVRAGESAEDIYASRALDSLPRRFADPMKLLYDLHKSMWAHYNTLSPDIV